MQNFARSLRSFIIRFDWEVGFVFNPDNTKQAENLKYRPKKSESTKGMDGK